jgi:hypothetical protein
MAGSLVTNDGKGCKNRRSWSGFAGALRLPVGTDKTRSALLKISDFHFETLTLDFRKQSMIGTHSVALIMVSGSVDKMRIRERFLMQCIVASTLVLNDQP